VAVTFKDNPRLKDQSGSVFDNTLKADVRKDDIVAVKAPLCPAQDSVANKQKSVSSASIAFQREVLPPRAGQEGKYVMVGWLAPTQ
jgi:hypothetical protein